MKKGITMVPMTWAFQFNLDYHATVSIFAADGSVAITHGGVETGQGINTKVGFIFITHSFIPFSNIGLEKRKRSRGLIIMLHKEEINAI